MTQTVLTTNDNMIADVLKSIRMSMRKADELAENSFFPLNSELYLTDKDVSTRLHISKRTLQEYRNTNVLPYFIIGGKVLYRESDIQALLESNYRKSNKDL